MAEANHLWTEGRGTLILISFLPSRMLQEWHICEQFCFSSHRLLSMVAVPDQSRREALAGILWALNALLHGTTSYRVKALCQWVKVIETTFS